MSFDFQPTLTGDLLELRPLEKNDYRDLFDVASDPLIWEQHPVWNRYKESVFKPFFEESLQLGSALVATDKKTKAIIGSSRYYAYDDIASDVEIGWTFLARVYWGGIYNSEMKRLMLGHAFRYVDSVVLLVGVSNFRSQRAAEKIGGKRDGVRVDALGNDSYAYRIRACDTLT